MKPHQLGHPPSNLEHYVRVFIYTTAVASLWIFTLLKVKHGLQLAIMTGGHNENVRSRYEYLGVKDVYISCSMKIRTWEEFLKKYDLKEEEIIYVGDDIPDYEVMKRAGCPCCPKDACAEIKEISTYVSDSKGGYGVARDILEQVMKAQGKWVLNEKAFGW